MGASKDGTVDLVRGPWAKPAARTRADAAGRGLDLDIVRTIIIINVGVHLALRSRASTTHTLSGAAILLSNLRQYPAFGCDKLPLLGSVTYRARQSMCRSVT